MKIDKTYSRTVGIDVIKGLDRQILHALQVNGRAPFSLIGEVLGVSDQTVARRYRALRQSGVQVIGALDLHVAGEVAWTLRIRCQPDASVPVAQALARREDTAWVSLVAGGTEVVCGIRAPDDGLDELLLDRLPKTPRITDIRAYCLMHTFFGRNESPLTKDPVLDDAQVATLAQGASHPRGTAGSVTLDAADRRLLAELKKDGRATIAELAKATGWSATTTGRRLEELTHSGAVYFDIDVDSRRMGFKADSLMWLQVAPGRITEVGEALAGHPEIAFATATTGDHQLHAALVCRDVPSLYRYLTERVATLPAVVSIDTQPVLRTLKGSGMPR